MKTLFIALFTWIQISLAADYSDTKIKLIQPNQDKGLFDTKVQNQKELVQIRKEVLQFSPMIQSWSTADQNIVALYFQGQQPDSIQARRIDGLLSKIEKRDPIANAVNVFNAIVARFDLDPLTRGSQIGVELRSTPISVFWRCRFWNHLASRQARHRYTDYGTYPSWTDDIRQMLGVPFPNDPESRLNYEECFNSYWSSLGIDWREYFHKVIGNDFIKDPFIRKMLDANQEIDVGFRMEMKQQSSGEDVSDSAKAELKAIFIHAAQNIRDASKLSETSVWPSQLLFSIQEYIDMKPDEARYWLNFGLRKQFGLLNVIRAYQNYVLVSPYSSEGAALQFATECLNTARFDTYVPYISIETMRKYGATHGDPGILFRKPGVYEMVKHYYEYRIPETDKIYGLDPGTRTQYMFIAILCNDLDTARKLWEILKGKIVENYLEDYNMTKESIIKALYPSRQGA